ncbi:helix-turn-helix domain-containing protein [Streptomyces sp. NPDC102364]|uniref:helix-turn-helix domain-containing protein n=1 Tax=Streptomyces sp. NPDC102364 TaxID=3366161 RepID=UPI003819207E
MPDQYGAEASLARNVRAARKWHGVSQKRLAARMVELGCPMSEATLCQLENGKRRIVVDELAALAQAFEVPLPVMLVEPFAPRPVEAERKFTVGLADETVKDVVATSIDAADGWLWLRHGQRKVFGAPQSTVTFVQTDDE